MVRIKKITALLLALLVGIGAFCGCFEPPEDLRDDYTSSQVLSSEQLLSPDGDSRDESSPVDDSSTEDLSEESECTSELQDSADESVNQLDENGAFTTAEDVSLYIYTYGHLPDNFITKNEARSLGWEGGGLEKYAPGKCIGGDRFGNYEGLLPKKSGRTYYECDIDTLGASSRGAKRIVFSNDGLVYYTDDHYETFTLLYGEE